MASKKAIATVLSIFHETFPTRAVSGTTAEVWLTVFHNVEDDALMRAALRLARDPDRRFFPTTGEVFAAMGAEARPVDVLNIIHRIECLGFYDPHRGWVYPTYATIKDALGEDIANAYTVAGGPSIYADDSSAITREISRRKFGEQLEEAQRRQPGIPLLRALPAPREELLPELPRERTPQFLGNGSSTRSPSPLLETVNKVVEKIEVESEPADEEEMPA